MTKRIHAHITTLPASNISFDVPINRNAFKSPGFVTAQKIVLMVQTNQRHANSSHVLPVSFNARTNAANRESLSVTSMMTVGIIRMKKTAANIGVHQESGIVKTAVTA